jgi:hypothetical protein
MKKRMLRLWLGLYLLAVATLCVGPARAQSDKAHDGSRAPDVAKDVTDAFKGSKDKDWVTKIAAVIGLIGTGVPLLSKALEAGEAFSARSRRKHELDRIQELIVLMQNTKKDTVLSESTRDLICVQIEAEIHASLEGLAKNREHRLLVMKKGERANSDLTLTRSALLVFRPHGFRAWLAHLLAYFWVFCTVFFALLTPFSESKQDLHILGSLCIFSLFSSLLFRMWALRLRARWLKSHPPPPTMVGSVGEASQAAARS